MPTVLITGAGSGLGRELSLSWARRGWRVVATDRDPGRAADTASSLPGDQAHLAMTLEVTRDESFDDCLTALGDTALDVVVNNAGIASAGKLIATPLDQWDRVLDVNLKGVVRGCRAFLPHLAANGGGHIVNIASFAGIANAPAMATYNVAKAGVIALSETLRTELHEENIGVTVVCPSFFQTALLDDAESFGLDLKGIGGKLMARSPLSAADVAECVVNDAAAGRFMCIPHRDARWLHRLKRLAPDVFARLMVKKARGLMRQAR